MTMTDKEWTEIWRDFDFESESFLDEEFQQEMIKKHGDGYYYMGPEESWSRQKDLIQKLVEEKLKAR
jgi:hypothetical protein